MRVFVTGGAGFIGSSVVRQLRARGDDVVAAVRDPGKAPALAQSGCTVVQSDLSSVAALQGLMVGADGVIHGAGMYRIGIRPSERPGMEDANVGATGRVLDAAIAAGIPRIAYISTGNVYGDTHGQVVDETFTRDISAGFLSFYDETKYRAHQAAEARIAEGAPVAIAMPGQVYGPGDHSAIGEQLGDAFSGRLRYVAFGDLGVGLGYVDDVAAGVMAVLDRGRPGEAYNIAGPPLRQRQALEIAARLGGKRLPGLTVPTGALRLAAPLAPFLPGAFGLPANLAEVIAAADGVSYWLSSAKAERELGFSARHLESGLRLTFGVA